MPKTKKKKVNKKPAKKKVKKVTKKVVKKTTRKSRKRVARRPSKKSSSKKAIKKSSKKPAKKVVKVKKKEKLIGRVTHYFDKIKVAVVKLKSPLRIDDKIRIVGGEIDFTQKVKSMEIEHKKIKQAKAKQEIGLKVKDKARDGYRVYKIY